MSTANDTKSLFSYSGPVRAIGRRDSSSGYGYWQLSLPLSRLSSVLGDRLKTSVTVSSVVSHLVFCRFLEASSGQDLTAADAQQVTLLGLLDLSAAFDCVDHQLLQHRLHRDLGLTDTVLNWVTSFVTGRSQQVACNGLLSTIQYLQFGVPQGSVLGPILFVMYTEKLSHVVAQHDLKFHQCRLTTARSTFLHW